MPNYLSTEPPVGVRTPLNIIVTICGVSVLASVFLIWLVYYHQPTDVTGTQLVFLPALNAVFNTLCTIALLAGYYSIRHGHVIRHRNSMFAAFFFSTLFLVSYIANHALHGDAHFAGHGLVRFGYFALLISHVLLSVLALPMILTTFYLALTGKFIIHRIFARYTFPIWLYVSVTGVIVYAMLAGYARA